MPSAQLPSSNAGAGPLSGVKIIEVAGIGPGPFGAMLLADLGAEVIRFDRVDGSVDPGHQVMGRGRRSIAIDLKRPAGRDAALRFIDRADVLIEGFRPGVMERLGLGPEPCRARNPRLVFARATGWGQEGPLAQLAGHDINYIAVAGALAHIARADGRPLPPLNLVGDFGGGGMLLALGVVSALVERERSGEGQVVDAAIVDATATLMAMFWGMRSRGAWDERPGVNLLDTGAPFYNTYETADEKYVAIGPLEPKFYRELLERLGLDPEEMPGQLDRSSWPTMSVRFEELFKTKTRDEWCALFDASDGCFAPVLTMSEARQHEHLRARATVIDFEGISQPAPSPRFSRTPGAIQCPAASPGQHTKEVLLDWGFGDDEIDALRAAEAIAEVATVR
jgi:alpha-methylacyl-CoA racemase